MVRILHSDWRARLYWRYGMVLYKSESYLRLELEPQIHKLTLLGTSARATGVVFIQTVRGPSGAPKMGSLIESIDTLISDWLTVNVKITLPCIGCFANGLKECVRFRV